MSEQIDQLTHSINDQVASSEQSSQYTYETSYSLPRFIGVPADDQLLEKSSLEGIFNGRTISQVYESDTNELAQEGVTWEQASLALTHLAVATSFQVEEANRIIDEVNKRILGGKKGWEIDSQTREKGERELREAISNMPDLPGFPGIKAQQTGARFQFDNPIKNPGMQGEAHTDLELIADNVRESDVTFVIDGKKVTSTINPLTYYLATAHHLLEKGNRYELTGKQLASIVKLFNAEEFDKRTAHWVKSKAEVIRDSLPVVPNHKEKVTFNDGTTIELNGGANVFISTNKQLRVLGFNINPDAISPVRVMSGDSDERFIYEDGTWKGRADEYDTLYKELPEASPYHKLLQAAERIRKKALAEPDRLLEGSIEDIKELSDVVLTQDAYVEVEEDVEKVRERLLKHYFSKNKS